ncbi:hypothetical protein KBC75_06250 [Candidatus Shapirobacteria bacterium]|nr:hypothetical protein [Candidatus Shapirobacteria bacterium]
MPGNPNVSEVIPNSQLPNGCPPKNINNFDGGYSAPDGVYDPGGFIRGPGGMKHCDGFSRRGGGGKLAVCQTCRVPNIPE